MSHAHERTLVQSLMLDEDRKHPLHDLACEYVSLPEVAVEIARDVCAPRKIPVDTARAIERRKEALRHLTGVDPDDNIPRNSDGSPKF